MISRQAEAVLTVVVVAAAFGWQALTTRLDTPTGDTGPVTVARLETDSGCVPAQVPDQSGFEGWQVVFATFTTGADLDTWLTHMAEVAIDPNTVVPALGSTRPVGTGFVAGPGWGANCSDAACAAALADALGGRTVV